MSVLYLKLVSTGFKGRIALCFDLCFSKLAVPPRVSRGVFSVHVWAGSGRACEMAGTAAFLQISHSSWETRARSEKHTVTS